MIFVFLLSGIKMSKGWKPELAAPPIHVNFNHCARFVLALSTKPALPPMWQRWLLLAPASYGSKEED